MHYAPQKNDVYVYFRYTDKQKIMVLLNKNTQSVNLDLKRYTQMVPLKFKAKDIVSDKKLEVENTLSIPPKSAMILEIE
jgi:neopullulanase